MGFLSLIVRLGADTSGFSKGVKGAGVEADGIAARLKRSFRGLGGAIAATFGVAAVAGFTRSIGAAISRIKDLSEQLETTADRVQDIDFAFGQSGASAEKFQRIQQRIKEAMTATAAGEGKFTDIFDTIGAVPSEMDNADAVIRKLAANIDKLSVAQLKALGIQQRYVQAFRDLAAVDNGTLAAPNKFTDAQIQQVDQAVKRWERLKQNLQVNAVDAFVIDADSDKNSLQRMRHLPDGRAFRGSGASGGWGDPMQGPLEATAAEAATASEQWQAKVIARASELREIQGAQAELQKAMLALQMDTASEEGKRVLLNQQILEHQERAAFLREHGFEAEAIKEEAAGVGIQRELGGLRGTGGGIQQLENSGRLGLFLGGRNDPLVDINRQQLVELRGMHKTIQKLSMPTEINSYFTR